MPGKSLRTPKYAQHKPTGQARVRIDGRDHYLGAFASPESRDRYDELISEWLARQDTTRFTLTVDELALLYLDHAERHYRRKDGSQTGEIVNIRIAMKHTLAVHGRTRARDFGPKALKEVRAALIRAGMARKSVNVHVGRIRRMFKWAVADELVPESVWRALQSVDGLQRGRCDARETDDVKPVAAEIVEATLPHLSRVVQAMVRLQLLTGARPTEICILRPCDVTRGLDGVWTYRPAFHKVEHHNRARRIFLGPEAQEIVRLFLEREPESHCFSPAEAEAERRKPATRRVYRDRYTKDSYNRAVQRACEVAFRMPRELRDIRRTVAKLPAGEQGPERERLSREASAWRARHCWSPNQLRHARATLIRARYGLEAARVTLGHTSPQTTEIYAEPDFALATEIMKQIG